MFHLLVKDIFRLLVTDIFRQLVKDMFHLLVKDIFRLLVKDIFHLLVKDIFRLLVKDMYPSPLLCGYVSADFRQQQCWPSTISPSLLPTSRSSGISINR